MAKQIKHTGEQKKELVEKICELYESDTYTIESCCESFDISSRSFYDWINENAELAERYKKAKYKQDIFYKQRLRGKAKTSLEKLIEGYEYEETNVEGKESIDEETGKSKFKPTKIVKVKKQVQPNATLIMYALNNSNVEEDKTFNHSSVQKVDITSGGEKIKSSLDNLSADDLKTLLALKKKARQDNA